MSKCDHPAMLIVTMTPEGTATNIVRRRIELRCGLELGHSDAHRDLAHGEVWTGNPGKTTTLLRDEDE